MNNLKYAFQIENYLDQKIEVHRYIVLPMRSNYKAGLRQNLKKRPKIIFDQITSKSLYLKGLKGTGANFFFITRRMLEIKKELNPELCFVPAFASTNLNYTENIEKTQEIMNWDTVREQKDLAGLVLGDNEDEWISWIKLFWGRNRWGIITNNNPKAVRFLLNEAKELEHVHLFENNWLLNPTSIIELQSLPIAKITFSDQANYTLLKQLNQKIIIENKTLIKKLGRMSLEEYLKTIEQYLFKNGV